MENDEPFFEIFDSGNFLRITPIRYKYYSASDDWDKNWLEVQIKVKAGAFSAVYKADLMTIGFKTLKDYFEYIYNHLSGEFQFENIEHCIKLNLKGDGIGHFEIDCTVTDEPGYLESSLSFYLSIDQTQIMPLVRQLDTIIAQFPIIGTLWNK